MADLELDAATASAYYQVVGGRRVIVISQLGGDRCLLVLPSRDPDSPVHRLALQFAQLADRTRAEARHDAHRGGFVIVAPLPDDGFGGPVSGAG